MLPLTTRKHSPFRGWTILRYWVALLGFSAGHFCDAAGAEKKVLLIAGTPSHGPGQHEHNAGVLLLQKCLSGVPNLKAEVSLNGWPSDSAAFAGVDAVLIFCDGGGRHLAIVGDHPAILEAAVAKGAGIGFIHYAVEPTKANGQAEFLRWVGGCFEVNRSVNPVWEPTFQPLPNHPIARGVHPFTVRDEWYYHLRFVDGMRGVTPLLVAIPTAATLTRPDGPHEGNPDVRAAVARGEPETVAWAFERADGGRGFGFAGAHYHQNWGNPDFRTLVLNAIVWLAKMEVPADGVHSTVSAADLAANLDPKRAPAEKK
jgi:hypothetical protein